LTAAPIWAFTEDARSVEGLSLARSDGRRRHGLVAIEYADQTAKADPRPSIICVNRSSAMAAQQGRYCEAHGEPSAIEEVKLSSRTWAGLYEEPFTVPTRREQFSPAIDRGGSWRTNERELEAYAKGILSRLPSGASGRAAVAVRLANRRAPCPADKPMATREASAGSERRSPKALPMLIGGSADLRPRQHFP